MAKERSVLLIGGPDAGKSNFLFRLWLAIEQKRGALVANGMPDDIEYLSEGAEALLQGQFAPRTPTDGRNHVCVPVKARDEDATSGKLVVLDCSGERWLEIYDKREWSSEWEDLITEETGYLLFLRADSDKIITPLDWISCHKIFGTVDISPLEAAEETALDPGGETADSSKRSTPTQVMLVEWLQFLRRAFTDRLGGTFRPRIGIVVAAWDSVPREEEEPMNYIARNFPMLEQFVRANTGFFDAGFFGLSVAGGDLSTSKYRNEFLAGDPHAQGFVVYTINGNTGTSLDHTLPIAWALGLEPVLGVAPLAR